MSSVAPAAAAAAPMSVNPEAWPKEMDCVLNVVKIVDKDVTADMLRTMPLDKVIGLAKAILVTIPAQKAKERAGAALKAFFSSNEQEQARYLTFWNACGVTDEDRKTYVAELDHIVQIDPAKVKWVTRGAVSEQFAERMRQLCVTAFDQEVAVRKLLLTNSHAGNLNLQWKSAVEADTKSKDAPILNIDGEQSLLTRISLAAFARLDYKHLKERDLKAGEADSKLSTALLVAQRNARLFAADYTGFELLASLITKRLPQSERAIHDYRHKLRLPVERARHAHLTAVVTYLQTFVMENQALVSKIFLNAKAVTDRIGFLKYYIQNPDENLQDTSSTAVKYAQFYAGLKAACKQAETTFKQELRRIYSQFVKSAEILEKLSSDAYQFLVQDNISIIPIPQPPEEGAVIELGILLNAIARMIQHKNESNLAAFESEEIFTTLVLPTESHGWPGQSDRRPVIKAISDAVSLGIALDRSLTHVRAVFEAFLAAKQVPKPS